MQDKMSRRTRRPAPTLSTYEMKALTDYCNYCGGIDPAVMLRAMWRRVLEGTLVDSHTKLPLIPKESAA